MGPNAQGTGETYLFVTPQAVDASGYLRAAYSLMGPGVANETIVDFSTALPAGATSHVALVINDTSNVMSLYLNGTAMTVSFEGALSSLLDENNWLGRSQFSADPEFSGDLIEFRVYNRALTGAQVQTSREAGPDPAFLLD